MTLIRVLNVAPEANVHPDVIAGSTIPRGTRVIIGEGEYGVVETFMYDGRGHLDYSVRRLTRSGAPYKRGLTIVSSEEIAIDDGNGE